jgi:threonine aldolase
MPAIVDLRSDTMTRPTRAMRAAMAEAEVGDDVFGEDPTVNRLEALSAEIAGKEAALFVPSGTMANQLAIRCQTNSGDEAILEAGTHPLNYESGGPAALSGVQLRPVVGQRGVFTAEQVAEHLRGTNDHYAPVTLVIIENTHNRAGGAVFPIEEMRRIRELAQAKGLAVSATTGGCAIRSVSASPKVWGRRWDRS